jgi:hypothetical protein
MYDVITSKISNNPLVSAIQHAEDFHENLNVIVYMKYLFLHRVILTDKTRTLPR